MAAQAQPNQPDLCASQEKKLNLESHSMALEGLRGEHRKRLEEAAGALGGLAALEEKYDFRKKELALRRQALKDLTDDLTENDGHTGDNAGALTQVSPKPNPNPNPNTPPLLLWRLFEWVVVVVS